MKIPVIFVNGSVGTIRIEDLDELLEKQVVVGFRRSSGWAMAGKDELRSSRNTGEGSWRDRKSNRLLLNMRAQSNALESGVLLYQWEGTTGK